MFRIFTTKEFDDNFNKLNSSEKQRIRKIMDQLKRQGANVGKPLKVPYFREKKFENKRLYFLVYENYMIVLAIAISNKKAQQETINRILLKINQYKDFIDEILKNLN